MTRETRRVWREFILTMAGAATGFLAALAFTGVLWLFAQAVYFFGGK